MKKSYRILFIILLVVAFSLLSVGVFFLLHNGNEEDDILIDDGPKEQLTFEDYLSRCALNVYESNQHLDYKSENGQYFISLNQMMKKFQCDISSYDKDWGHCDPTLSGILMDDSSGTLQMTIALQGCITPEK